MLLSISSLNEYDSTDDDDNNNNNDNSCINNKYLTYNFIFFP